ncbi:DUF4917 family protein [Mycobacterium heidelbergense]|uniref:Uncharacterized protein n=1 Tax=Mycobacterium heidelbergense TaxID=53376 RepID=A0A1X0DSW8_MYCHE|nr:DUF4917 family protein [Mycobacterium heidelbergense]MCV7051730.1 DUF4917 family protein [Mycobacterium heidelbergense]ORA75455.1 hypothetical protein BST25_05930 [Mycobacterium heidelbergense]BBZ50282.1 DUF4917 domain-containing protein [Mycobacterium heidelbergense]
MAETDNLVDWSSLSEDVWPTLLIGNGLSINTWRRFSYSELLTVAALEPPAIQIFSDLETTNFEEVLEGLWHAERVLVAMGQESIGVRDLYAHVRHELVAAIKRVHIRWTDMPVENLQQIAAVLDQHRWVFTLNYDLLTYWASMDNQTTTEIVDFLWNNPFDPLDSEIWSASATGLVFLHGGIHLWQNSATGESGKWTNQQPGGLLSQLDETLETNPDRQPLIVSEGRCEQKLRAIRRSDYLSFAYQQLSTNTDPTVVFGASFGAQDAHIVKGLRKGGRRRIAISVLPGEDYEIIATMARYRANLPDQDLVFFNSTTHPLGDAALRVADNRL